MSIVQYSNLVLQTDSPVDRLQSGKCYDLAIIGAGISAAYTLIHYLELLESDSNVSLSNHQPVKIVVTEKSGDFWTGIPYGSRSGKSCLLISPLIEFIPQPAEREHFTNWLTANRNWLFDPQADNEGELASKWLQANQADIDRGLWDDLFIPRQIFGKYLKQRVTNLLAAATSKGLIEIDLVTADVLDVERNRQIAPEEYSTYFATKKLVIAIGSPPNVAFERSEIDTESDLCYVDNMYEPSLDVNLDRICKSLAQQSDRQVLIVGSNAGTLDTLYSLNDSKVLTSLVEKFTIVSPNAAFPHRISREVPAIDYTPQSLVALLTAAPFTAKQIFEAVRVDVAAATAKNINISDIHGNISKVVMQALNLLDLSEQEQFVSKYAVEIGKLQRRAGGEYLDVVDNLVAQGKLTFLKGKFVKHLPLPTGGSGCEYIDSDNRQSKISDTPIGVIINCAGFQDVTKSSSVLIQNLLSRKICAPNDSNRGFIIDKNFEASENCYVMGPLVAGNIDGSFKVWHAESCQRIIGLSQHLAKILIQPDPAVTAVEIGVLVNAG